MLFKKTWKHKLTTANENSCKLFGVRIFDYDWERTGEMATVRDPMHHQEHQFNVYTVNIKGKTKKFAAGEFSNSVWGFFTKRYL